MPTPTIDVVESATTFTPMVALFLGAMIGIVIGVGAMWLKERELKKVELPPP